MQLKECRRAGGCVPIVVSVIFLTVIFLRSSHVIMSLTLVSGQYFISPNWIIKAFLLSNTVTSANPSWILSLSSVLHFLIHLALQRFKYLGDLGVQVFLEVWRKAVLSLESRNPSEASLFFTTRNAFSSKSFCSSLVDLNSSSISHSIFQVVISPIW